jgi:hypothetical protein
MHHRHKRFDLMDTDVSVKPTASDLRRKAEYEASRSLRDVCLFLRLLCEDGAAGYSEIRGVKTQKTFI